MGDWSRLVVMAIVDLLLAGGLGLVHPPLAISIIAFITFMLTVFPWAMTGKWPWRWRKQ